MPISENDKFFSINPIRKDRVHEASGSARECFALSFASYLCKETAWIGNNQMRLNPYRFQEFLYPSQLYQIQCYSQEDRLWVMEEALRSNSFGLVVNDVVKPLSLLEGRRLQLAAEAGKTIGLCLIKPEHGANTAETRWHCEPTYPTQSESDSTHWQWYLKKNKKGTIGAWEVKWNAKTHHVNLVSNLANQSSDAKWVG